MACCLCCKSKKVSKNDSPLIDVSIQPTEEQGIKGNCNADKGTKHGGVTEPKEEKQQDEISGDGYIVKKLNSVIFEKEHGVSRLNLNPERKPSNSWWNNDETRIVRQAGDTDRVSHDPLHNENGKDDSFASVPFSRAALPVEQTKAVAAPNHTPRERMQLESNATDHMALRASELGEDGKVDQRDAILGQKNGEVPVQRDVSVRLLHKNRFNEVVGMDKVNEINNTDNDWNLYGYQDVEIDNEHGDATAFQIEALGENVDELPHLRSQHGESNLIVDAPCEDKPSIHDVNGDEPPMTPFPKVKPRANPLEPKPARPLPLKRGTRPIPSKRKVGPLKPTPATVAKLIEHLATLDDSKWKEQIKDQSEISDIAQKHPDVLLQCSAEALITVARAIIMQANSGRSNVSNGGIITLGILYKECKSTLNPLLSSAIGVCLKKASSGSPEFICNSATATLAKICLSCSEVKLASILLQKYRENKSAQLVSLNCIIIILDRLGDGLSNLKALGDILEVAITALGAGSLQLRLAANIIVGMINEQKCVVEMLKKMRKSDDSIHIVTNALKKYRECDKTSYLEKLKLSAT